MYMYIKRVKAEIAYHNKFAQSKALPYWAKLLRVMLEMNMRYHSERWAITNKLNHWFFKKYLEGKVSE